MKKKNKKKPVYKFIAMVHLLHGEIMPVHFNSADDLSEFIAEILTVKHKETMLISHIMIPNAKVKVK